MSPKSLYISNFYGTEIEIWAGFGPVGNTEKKFGPILSNFWGCFFHVFMGTKKFKRGSLLGNEEPDFKGGFTNF
jgi:hypothetical protein